jgi:hypothetical protein
VKNVLILLPIRNMLAHLACCA